MAKKLSLETKKKWLEVVKDGLKDGLVVAGKIKFETPDAMASLASFVFNTLDSASNLYLETQEELDKIKQDKVRKSRSKSQIALTPTEVEELEAEIESEDENDS